MSNIKAERFSVILSFYEQGNRELEKGSDFPESHSWLMPWQDWHGKSAFPTPSPTKVGLSAKKTHDLRVASGVLLGAK